MTPEMQKKRDELLVSADCGMFSSPDRWVGFRRGFNAAHDLMQDEIFELKDKLNHYFQYIGDDGPEQSCPFVDSVIKRFPETANTMERIRTINVQLRFNLEKERQKVKGLVEALRSLTNEASGFLSQANPYDHGHTNMEVMRLRIQKAREALKGLKE